jgi:serine/threonine protein kinase
MQLQPGTRLGIYEVIGPLGAGGMGEVYRARDTRLDREVALKLLPEAFARDPERLARFEREAKVLASLNHPNIAAIYGLEESSGVRFLVMEFVPGEELRGPLVRGVEASREVKLSEPSAVADGSRLFEVGTHLLPQTVLTKAKPIRYRGWH